MFENVNPKKYLGQHFLIDENISKKIVNSVDFSRYNKIIEIGPGRGALTKYIIDQGEKLSLVEIDNDSVNYLKETFYNQNLYIIEKDFLKLKFEDEFRGFNKILIFGNFPYNISSQIIFKVLDNYKVIDGVTGMFQKEVAERIVSKPNNKNYGILSVKTQLYYDVEILFDISPNVFFPKPKVKSSIIKMVKKINPNLNCNLKLLDTIIKLSFQQRRKKIRNSLKKLDINENIIEDSIFDLRPEQLSVNDFVRLTQKISNEPV
ncbi:MAG: 16S rRNA (adenine(1518)-N(6)/adenine(1519)-N(6))-dimethyltransferase RsmA [Bacteroidota bacterium]